MSVANLTREDGRGLMQAATTYPLSIHTKAYALLDANIALDDLRAGHMTGAAALRIPTPG